MSSADTLPGSLAGEFSLRETLFQGTKPWEVTAVVLLLIAASLYLLHLARVPIVTNDSLGYLSIAEQLGDGIPDSLPERSLGYAYLLAMCARVSNSLLFVTALQSILYLLGIFALFMVLRSSVAVNHLRRPWRLAFLLVTLLPFQVSLFARTILTEVPTFFLLALSLTTLWYGVNSSRRILLGVGSILCALTGIMRPTYYLLSPTIVIALLVPAVMGARLLNARQRSCLRWFMWALMLSWIGIIGGMHLFNGIRFGHFQMTSLSAGFFISQKSTPVLEYLPDSLAQIRAILIEHRDSLLLRPFGGHTGWGFKWEALPALREALGMSDPEISSLLGSVNLLLAKQKPFSFLEMCAMSAARFFLPATELPALARLGGIYPAAYGLFHIAYLGLIAYALAISFYYLLLYLRAPSKLGRAISAELLGPGVTLIIIAVLVSYTWVIASVVEHGHPRYRLPLDPLILLFCYLVIGTFHARPAVLPSESEVIHG